MGPAREKKPPQARYAPFRTFSRVTRAMGQSFGLSGPPRGHLPVSKQYSGAQKLTAPPWTGHRGRASRGSGRGRLSFGSMRVHERTRPEGRLLDARPSGLGVPESARTRRSIRTLRAHACSGSGPVQGSASRAPQGTLYKRAPPRGTIRTDRGHACYYRTLSNLNKFKFNSPFRLRPGPV